MAPGTQTELGLTSHKQNIFFTSVERCGNRGNRLLGHKIIFKSIPSKQPQAGWAAGLIYKTKLFLFKKIGAFYKNRKVSNCPYWGILSKSTA
jgi:hypothetical protein